MKNKRKYTINAGAKMDIDNLDWGRNEECFVSLLKQEIFEDKLYEKYFEVKEGDVVVDLGANVGAFAASILHKKPKKIFCVEPSNGLIQSIKNNTEGHPVQIVQKAISEKTQTNAKLNNQEAFVYWHDGDVYDTITFKDFLKEYNIDKIDFLKFDCEGGEYNVFAKENYEFISKKVKYMVGEWHINDHKNSIERFIQFRDLYLKYHKNYRIFERSGKEVTFEIFNNEYLYGFRDWWKDTQLGQFIIYINNVEPKHEFLFNNNSKNRIWVVDDFYLNPVEVRNFALKQEFIEGGFGRGFIGRRTALQFLFPGLKERFQEIMGREIIRWEEHPMNGRFQVAWAGEPLVYHCDDQRWAGMLFLTPDAPVECGTSTYIHKATKIRHASDPNILSAFRQESTLDRTPYQPVDVIGNIFNRLVIFDARCIHSASEYFGFNKENSRLWQMFFFD